MSIKKHRVEHNGKMVTAWYEILGEPRSVKYTKDGDISLMFACGKGRPSVVARMDIGVARELMNKLADIIYPDEDEMYMDDED